MVLELADEGRYSNFRTHVRGYHRRASDVQGYDRRRLLKDSSLFSFKLADQGYLYLCVPDPFNKQAPRYVREDMFDNLSDDEMLKVLQYVECFNPEPVFAKIIQSRNERTDGSGNESARQLVLSVFQNDLADGLIVEQFDPVPSKGTLNPGQQIQVDFWDQEILGIKYKYAIPGAVLAALLYSSK